MALLDVEGSTIDEARTPHIENAKHPKWEETLRLFLPDDEAPTGATQSVPIRLAVWDWNRKKAHEFIADAKVDLAAGSGKIKVELASRAVSGDRPVCYLRYELTPQMFFEEVEYVRVSTQAVVSTEDDSDTDD